MARTSPSPTYPMFPEDAAAVTPSDTMTFEPSVIYVGSAGLIEDTFAAILPLDIPATEDTEARRTPGQPEVVLAALPEDYAPQPTLAEVEALFAAIDVTEGDALARMQTLGLAMCQANSEDPSEEINVR